MPIVVATDDEAAEILRESQIVRRTGIAAPKHMEVQPWLVEDGDHRMMFVFWLVAKGVAEVHIACPKKSIIRSRPMAMALLDWLKRHGVRRVVTNCPSNLRETVNMARKLGFSESRRGETSHFEVSL